MYVYSESKFHQQMFGNRMQILVKYDTYSYIVMHTHNWFSFLACPVGTAYHECSRNISCSDITGVRSCKEQSPCTSGCFCSDGTVLVNGTCSNISSCSGIAIASMATQ